MKVSREFLIGVFVVTAISLLYIGVNYLKGVNLFLKQQTYFAVYENSAGLTPSNAVIINGYKIGIVKDVHMNENGDGTIIAEIVLNDSKLRIPEDTQLEIYDADLFGGKAIKILLGTSNILAEVGDTLNSKITLSMTESIKKEIEPLKEKTAKLFAGVDSIITNLNNVLSSSEVESIGAIFTKVKVTMENLEATSIKLNGILDNNSGKLDNIFANVESISLNLKNNNTSLSKAIKNIENLSDSLAKIQLSNTIRKVDIAVGELSSMLEKINNGQGTIGQLVNNDSLHTELTSASHSLDLLLNDMRVHPKKYLSFSLINRNNSDETFSKKELEEMRREIDLQLEKKSGKGDN